MQKWILWLYSIVAGLSWSCGDQNFQSHEKSHKEEMNLEKTERMTELKSRQSNSLRYMNFAQAAREQLDINRLQELKDSSDRPTTIERKYSILSEILEEKITQWEQQQAGHSFEGLTNNTYELLYEIDSQGQSKPDFSIAYHPLALQEVKKVFHDFGDLYINETIDERGKIKSDQVIVPTPWSGYWYPFGDSALYDKENSPLVKFDQVMRKKNRESLAADHEKERNRGFHPDSWEGMCDAWSVASLMTKEPKEARSIEGVHFSIADLKALLTFSHMSFHKKVYGIQYRGDVDTDGTYQDLKPEAFHQIVVSVLGQEKRGLVVDDDAGVQVWNKPMYRYLWKIEKDPKISSAFLVKAYPWMIRHRSKETEDITSSRDILAPNYTYRLYVDKKDVRDNKFKVIAGEWTEGSYKDHPDTVSYPLRNGSVNSHNAEFNKNIDLFKRIFLD